MTELPAPERIALIWSPEGRVDLRAIDRETAMQILHCVDRYLASRSGDVKKLKPPRTGFRLRCGDYRVFFDQKNDTTITITGVRHRRNLPLTCASGRLECGSDYFPRSCWIVDRRNLLRRRLKPAVKKLGCRLRWTSGVSEPCIQA